MTRKTIEDMVSDFDSDLAKSRKKTGERRRWQANISLSPEEYMLTIEAARIEGIPVSTFIRHLWRLGCELYHSSRDNKEALEILDRVRMRDRVKPV